MLLNQRFSDDWEALSGGFGPEGVPVSAFSSFLTEMHRIPEASHKVFLNAFDAAVKDVSDPQYLDFQSAKTLYEAVARALGKHLRPSRIQSWDSIEFIGKDRLIPEASRLMGSWIGIAMSGAMSCINHWVQWLMASDQQVNWCAGNIEYHDVMAFASK